ncbi:MAG: hypothetical protein VCA55_14140 [Verrucomicrobiales bacterium]
MKMLQRLMAMLVVLVCGVSVYGKGLCAEGEGGSLNPPEFPGDYIAASMVALPAEIFPILCREVKTGCPVEMCAERNGSLRRGKGSYAFISGAATLRVPAAETATCPISSSAQGVAVAPSWSLAHGH